LLAAQAVQMAGLTRADVTYTNRIRAADGLAALQNKAVDVLSSVEPTVGELVDQGLAVRLASSVDVMPWFQESYLAGSSDWLSKHQQAVASFLKAYLHAAKDITDNGPKWNPEHAQILSNWSKVPVANITRLPGPGYVGQYGAIRPEALARQQVFWASEGLVKTQVEPASIFDSSYLDQARKAMNLN
jgi:ABC-type nitrate/sulfonate/bicarbonate transport system substrate-binding protein